MMMMMMIMIMIIIIIIIIIYCSFKRFSIVQEVGNDKTEHKNIQDRPYTYKRNIEARSRNHSCCGKVGI
jgi:hypothetical protein